MAEQQAGDYLDQSDGYELSTEEELGKFKFSYPLLMEAQIRKLKQNLDSSKEIVLVVKRIFWWEQQWHPTALIGGSTVIFMLIWLLDPSFLTLVSTLGLSITLCDYLIPSIGSSLFKPEKWTPKKEKEFEDFCTHLILYKVKTELAWSNYFKMKETNRKLFYMITCGVLAVLAWVGCTFNNLFLAYLTFTCIILLPGMEQHGMISKWSQTVQSTMSQLLSQAKSKVSTPAAQDKKQK